MNRPHRALRILAASLMALACAGPSLARDASALTQACRDDYGKFCSGVKPGGGRVAQCLQEHTAELAPACQASMNIVSTCSAEVKKICGTQTSGTEGLRECAKAHASEFSAACKAAMASR